MTMVSSQEIKQYNIYLADLSPQFGTEPGKKRPVVVVQTDILNDVHSSTIVCPLTTNIEKKATILRVHLAKGECALKEESDILVDQIRAIDNRRFIKRLGKISERHAHQLKENLRIVILE
jgi:mRNA interferase MazF